MNNSWILIFVTLFSISALGSDEPKANPSHAVAAAAKPAGAEDSGELVVGVKNMVCTSCAEKIEKKFKALKEVENAQVNLEEESLTLRFKKGQRLSDEKIKAVLKDAGYEAVLRI